jgi:DNA-binding transcriptional LysR family regulator
MSLDPRDLKYFAMVAEHGNLRRAAEALELSQPGLSKGIVPIDVELRV